MQPLGTKIVPFKKVQPQWQLLYLFFWECMVSWMQTKHTSGTNGTEFGNIYFISNECFRRKNGLTFNCKFFDQIISDISILLQRPLLRQ